MQFFSKRVSFFGHIIFESGVEVDPENLRAIERMKEPSSLRDVKAFLGLVGYIEKLFRVSENSRTYLQVTE